MKPEDRAWLNAVHEQGNANAELGKRNSEAIQAIGETLKHLSENIALANVLLAATGTLCGEIAAEANVPHDRLEEILASFESGLERVMSHTTTPLALRNRVLAQLDVLRELAEHHLVTRLGRDG